MTPIELGFNKAVAWTVALACLYVLLLFNFDLNTLIVILNGILGGAMIAAAIAYHKLFIVSLFAKEPPFDRAAQFALAVIGLMTAVGLFVAASTQIRIIGGTVSQPSVVSVAARYVATVSVVLLVSAPDFGYSVIYGRDRKALVLGTSIGFISAIVLVWAQATEALSWFLVTSQLQLSLH